MANDVIIITAKRDKGREEVWLLALSLVSGLSAGKHQSYCQMSYIRLNYITFIRLPFTAVNTYRHTI